MKRMNRIGTVWYDNHRGKTIKRIAYEQCTTEEVIEAILDNYDIYQDKICGWGAD